MISVNIYLRISVAAEFYDAYSTGVTTISKENFAGMTKTRLSRLLATGSLRLPRRVVRLDVVKQY